MFFLAMYQKFLSTPSVRRATMSIRDYNTIRTISIHALREEGDGIVIAGGDAGAISIRALREEGDR